MSATLTWASSGAGTKLGTTANDFWTDTKTLVDSKAANTEFKWEISASNLTTASSPQYLWFRPKDGSNGRIILITWSSAPAGNNSAILDQAPATNVYMAYFPNGTAASPSNLTASSGSISGNDTGCTKLAPAHTAGGMYSASYVPFYLDSAEALIFGWQNPASSQLYFCAAGNIFVDAADTAYAGCVGLGSTNMSSFGSTSSPMSWSTSATPSGSAAMCGRAYYGGVSKLFYAAYAPSGQWASSAVSSTDIMTDTTNSKAWFVPVLMLSQTKGEGFVLKTRQWGYGPGTTGPLATYSTTGPAVQARQFTLSTTGGTGLPWFTNFKM